VIERERERERSVNCMVPYIDLCCLILSITMKQIESGALRKELLPWILRHFSSGLASTEVEKR